MKSAKTATKTATKSATGKPSVDKTPAPPKQLIADLVLANKILFGLNVVDAFGHISVRHPNDPGKYLMSRHLPPGMVTPRDIVLFDLDSTPLTHADKPQYSERFIHGEIYKQRPEVISVVHCHARPLIPFANAKGATLRPMFHMCGFLGCGVPVFEIRDAGGNTDMLVRTPALGKALADTLGDKNVVLMRGHGATMTGVSIQEVVFRAVYSMENAAIQMQAQVLANGSEVVFLNEEESELSGRGRNVPRAWTLWKDQFIRA
ncbi:MAG: class II aldolase/adducin family protein [Hyphomicrobiales bacterium]|nr:class II aldolase/adducin family protein [Hyphomicrobiales bacterium]